MSTYRISQMEWNFPRDYSDDTDHHCNYSETTTGPCKAAALAACKDTCCFTNQWVRVSQDGTDEPVLFGEPRSHDDFDHDEDRTVHYPDGTLIMLQRWVGGHGHLDPRNPRNWSVIARDRDAYLQRLQRHRRVVELARKRKEQEEMECAAYMEALAAEQGWD